jgi:hypothetical protein
MICGNGTIEKQQVSRCRIETRLPFFGASSDMDLKIRRTGRKIDPHRLRDVIQNGRQNGRASAEHISQFGDSRKESQGTHARTDTDCDVG